MGTIIASTQHALAGVVGQAAAKELCDQIDVLAELGVLMLLFIVGMELSLRSFRRLWRLAVIATLTQIASKLSEPAKGTVARVGLKMCENYQAAGAAGPGAATARLAEFTRGDAGIYQSARDDLARDATSRISPYLRFGMCSPRLANRIANTAWCTLRAQKAKAPSPRC